MFEPKKPFMEPSCDLMSLSQDNVATSNVTNWNTNTFDIKSIQSVNE